MARLKLQSSHRIVDAQGRMVIGEGRARLLALIDQTGSINQAAKQMGMAYKSAWSKIQSTQAHLGAPVVQSDKRTGSRLTPLGRRFLDQYRQMKSRCISADDRIFTDIFTPPPSSPPQGARTGPEPLPAASAMPPMLAVVGYSGSGKTTLIERLISVLTDRGIRVATIKHHHGGGSLDTPGKDTWRHRQAGALASIVAAPEQVQLVMAVTGDPPPNRLAGLLPPVDLILVEGYKRGALPKIEIYRPQAAGTGPPIGATDPWVRAIVTDTVVDLPSIPRFGSTDVTGIADFINAYIITSSDN